MSAGLPPKPDIKHKIMDVSLRVWHSYLARHMAKEYQSMVFPYDRVLRDRQIPVISQIRHGAGHSI